MEKALNHILSSSGEITAQVQGRIGPLRREEWPSITYERIDFQPEYNVNGSLAIADSQFAVSVFAERYSQAKELAELVKTALNGFIGTEKGTRILWTRQEGESEERSTDPDITTVRLDYTFTHH